MISQKQELEDWERLNELAEKNYLYFLIEYAKYLENRNIVSKGRQSIYSSLCKSIEEIKYGRICEQELDRLAAKCKEIMKEEGIDLTSDLSWYEEIDLTISYLNQKLKEFKVLEKIAAKYNSLLKIQNTPIDNNRSDKSV